MYMYYFDFIHLNIINAAVIPRSLPVSATSLKYLWRISDPFPSLKVL